MKFISETMKEFIYNLDGELSYMEKRIKKQDKKIKQLEKEAMEHLDKTLKDSWASVGNTLNAIISTPKLDSLSATVLSKIKNMNDLSEIHEYIDKVFKDNFEEVE